MPLISVQASIPEPDQATVDTLLKALSASLAKHTGKPEAYIMTAFKGNVSMTFGGTLEPVCYVEVKSVGSFTPAQTQAMSEDFSSQIEQAIAVPKRRTYLEFAEAKGYLWGWNGTTFG